MTLSNERAKLRDAIADQSRAQAVLEEAQTAAANARERFFAVNRKVDQLVAQIEDAAEQPSDKFIAELAGGLDVIVDRPVAELRKQLEAAEAEVVVWSAAMGVAEGAIEARRRALEQAQYYVDSAARRVVEAEVNVAAALCSAEALRNELLDAQARLAAIAGSMQHGDVYRTISNFTGDTGWLIDSNWRNRPAAQPIKDAFAALTVDAAAPL